MTPSLDRDAAALARELAELGSTERSKVFRMSWWSERMLDWAMARPPFKTQLFRFVDVFPATGWDRLPDIERYLQGMQRRLDKLPSDPGRDRERMLTVQAVQQEYDQLAASMSDRPELREIRWMIEELRVGLFAQARGTRYPISDVRVYRAMDQL